MSSNDETKPASLSELDWRTPTFKLNPDDPVEGSTFTDFMERWLECLRSERARDGEQGPGIYPVRLEPTLDPKWFCPDLFPNRTVKAIHEWIEAVKEQAKLVPIKVETQEHPDGSVTISYRMPAGLYTPTQLDDLREAGVNITVDYSQVYTGDDLPYEKSINDRLEALFINRSRS